MEENSDNSSNISNQHRAALNWFNIHRGTRVPWPERLPDGTFLLNRAKGIHKPAGWKYTLSVRQALGGPYADQDPEIGADGSWAYVTFRKERTQRSGTNTSPIVHYWRIRRTEYQSGYYVR